MQDWYWAARREGPAGDAFVIENGKDAMWRRVRGEIDAQERVMWNAIHKGAAEPELRHVMHLLLSIVPSLRINHNRFVFEAAKIPCFAQFLRDAPATCPTTCRTVCIPISPSFPSRTLRKRLRGSAGSQAQH